MTTTVPCSTSTISLTPGTVFTIKKNNHLTRCSLPRKSSKHTLSSQRIILPLLTSVGLFPQHRKDCGWFHRSLLHTVSATGTDTDVVVEEPDSPVADDGTAEISSDAVEKGDKSSNPAPAQARRSRPSRKSEMPPVKNDDLIPGATFTGKVKSIQPFGAFVDFGAFTDGLVHVSRLSDSYVKDVGSIVSVGQEVTVRLVEVNTEARRISLTMRERDSTNKLQQQKDAPSTASSDKPRPARRNTPRPSQKKDVKSSKFVKGQVLEGTVKNLTRSGAFISLPEGEEGFLPKSEESDLVNMTGESLLQVGQEVSVTVLRIGRGQVTLTMKEEEDNEVDEEGVDYVATNAFVLAFRKNKDIAAFLDEREKVAEPVKPKTLVEVEKQVSQSETVSDVAEVEGHTSSTDEGSVSDPSAVVETVEGETSVEQVSQNETVSDVAEIEGQPSSTDEESLSDPSAVVETVRGETSVEEVAVGSSNAGDAREPGSIQSSIIQSVEGAVQTVDKAAEISPEASVSGADKIVEEAPSIDGITKDGVEIQTPIAENEISSTVPVGDESIEAAIPDENGSISGSSKQADATEPQEAKDREESAESSEQSGSTSEAEILSSESQNIGEVLENQVESIKDENQTSVAETEGPSVIQIENEKVEPTPEKNGTFDNLNAQSNSASPEGSVTKATISPALVKQLREETGAGMMDCKKALSETGGDIVKAQEFLRKKGLASAEKKASRATAEGRIGSYIHDGRIGVLIEVNCETDFVSRGDIFKELVDDLAMQVAACPQVQYLVAEDVPEEIVNKEREIEMQKEDLLSKPEQIRSKIVDGRIRKRLEELALLEQPYIKNDKIAVKDWVKQTIATIGENMKVRRFVRYNLGEGLEKKTQDFAAEVAAQTAAKPVAAPAKEQPASEESNEAAKKPPAVTVSAAVVKQLREETGAGMMDCKKALSETGGDLEKAQEYLRKKGLSTADKKSSRLAAEGRIGSYIHDSRIGVLIEVNCETDFVGRSEKFKELVDDLAMQVVACPQVQFVSIEDISESILSKEKELEMQREDLLSKPENIREKIVEGRVSKRLGELALLEQPFIKDDSLLVKDLVKQTVAALGENIKVRRFVRFTLGETTEDTKTDTDA
ncbi:hypothetical protein JCGZ_07279 [Jatropha curcas]|uniref:Elongation factor Ts, mitochondrial n=1 Tax=Jatropha curcas TaxID=180498 RepID=A0A067KFH6_JATCU|nr:hypothetical protein JCGZ_07279 [Jatropha curcas]